MVLDILKSKMNTTKEEDDFWYSSETRSFCFESEVMIVNSKFYR